MHVVLEGTCNGTQYKKFRNLTLKFVNFSTKNFFISFLFSGPKFALLLENRALLEGYIRSLSRKMSKQKEITNYNLFQAKSYKLTIGLNVCSVIHIEIVQFHNLS